MDAHIPPRANDPGASLPDLPRRARRAADGGRRDGGAVPRTPPRLSRRADDRARGPRGAEQERLTRLQGVRSLPRSLSGMEGARALPRAARTIPPLRAAIPA